MKGFIMTQGKQPMYLYCGSSLRIQASPEMAAAYNRFIDKFSTATKAFEAAHGRPWEATYQLSLNVTESEIKAYNTVADIINLMVVMCGGAINIREEDMPTNHLELVE
jgi:hypothetical protein